MKHQLPLLALFVILAGAVGLGLVAPEHAMAFGFLGVTFVEGNRVSDWLKWEEDQRASRDDGLILAGQILKSGHIVGKTLVGAAGAAVAFAANTGNGTVGAITVGGTTKLGKYKVIFISATQFEIEDPDGKPTGHGGATGVAFSGGGLGFTITAGGTAFVPGDGFDITVTGGVTKWKEHDPAATDGSERAAGILLFALDTSATGTNADTVATLITRQALIGDADITWKAGMTAQQKTDALALLLTAGIIARKQV
jgi:hypothetical protein